MGLVVKRVIQGCIPPCGGGGVGEPQGGPEIGLDLFRVGPAPLALVKKGVVAKHPWKVAGLLRVAKKFFPEDQRGESSSRWGGKTKVKRRRSRW